MSDNLDNIGYNLILDDSGFRVTAQATAAQLKALEAQFASTGQGVAAIEAKINSAGVTFHQWVTSIGAVKFALMDLDAVFLSLPKSVLETSGELERLGVVLKGLSTASDDAGRSADAAIGKSFILNLEQNVPFKLQALTDTFVKFKTVGIDPMNGSMEALLNQVAKYGGGSEQLKSASLAIQQMAGKGVVSLQELRMQLSQAIPNAAQMMADAMGMSMNDLTKAISKGTVASGTAIKKMLAAFSLDSLGAANEQMQTWMGTLEKLNTKWDLFKADVGDAGFFKAAKDELNSIMELFGTPDAKNWAQGISDEFTSLIGLFHDGRVEIQQYLPQIIELGKVMLAVFATTTLANYMGDMRNALSGMNASWHDYATNAIASEGAVAAKKLSVTEQILAADQARRDSIALESEMRQDALSREIAANQQLIVANDARYAAIDAARKADLEKEIANNTAELAARNETLAELIAGEVEYSNAVVVEQNKRLAMGMPTNSATAAQYTAQAAYTAELEAGLTSMRAEIALLQEEQGLLAERNTLLRAAVAAEAETAAAQQGVNVAMSAENALLVEKNGALAVAIGAERQAVASMAAMSMGAAEVKTALLGLEFAFNALGGWLTVLAAAIVGGIALWNQFGDAAKRAANAAVDAANIRRSIAQGDVKQGDVDKTDAHIADKKNEIAQLQNQLAIAVNGQRVDTGFQAPDPQQADAIRAQIAKEKSALDDLIQMRANAQKELDASNVKLVSAGYAKKYQEDTDEEVSQIAKTGENEISAIKKRYEDKRSAMDSASAAYKQSQDAEAKEVQAAIQRGTTAIAAAYDKRDKELRDKIANVSGPDAQTQKAALEQELARVRQEEKNSIGMAQAVGAPNEFLAPKTPGRVADPTDGLAKTLARVKTQLDDAKSQLNQIVTGATEYAKLRADATQKVQDMLDGGQLDYKTHGKDGKTTRPSINDPKVQGLIDDETALQITQNAKQQMEQLKGKLAPMVAEYNETMSKLMSGDVTTSAGKEDDSALKFLEKLSTRSQDAAKELAPVIQTMKQVKLAADQLDLANYTREIVKADQTAQVALIDNTHDRLVAQLALENDAWQKEAQDRIQKVKNLGGNVDRESQLISEAAQTRAESQMRQLETPMQQMARTWQDTTDAMQKASTGWANSTIDAFVNMVKTGKFQFSSLVESIGTDMLKISLQKSLGQTLQVGYDALANGAASLIGGNSRAQQGAAAGEAANSTIMNLLEHPVDSLGKMLSSLTSVGTKTTSTLADSARQITTGMTVETNATNSMTTLTNAAYSAAQALASIAGGSGSSGGILGTLGTIASGFVSGLTGLGSSTAAALSSTSAMGSPSTLMGLQGGTNTLGNWDYGGSAMSNTFKFANGGIMSEFGPLALRKYANGGIADSPQVAIYGEGSMNEAFVPLPDGRSIPVTITGGNLATSQGSKNSAAPEVTVNIINSTNQPMNAQQGQTRFDGTKMIMDVVISAITTPGPYRDQFKGALST